MYCSANGSSNPESELSMRLAPGVGVGPEVLGDLGRSVDRRAEVLGLEVQSLHRDQVDEPLELAHRPFRPGADGDLHRDRVAFEPVLDLVEDAVELGADAVHLVDEAEPRDLVLRGLPPDGLALGLDPLDGREDDDGAVEHAERAFDLGGEVDVAGCVDDVDRDRLAVGRPSSVQVMAAATMVIPRSRSSSR